MSSKNLKTFKMQFVTDIRQLAMSVKFACKIKIIWKRSNQTVESQLAELDKGFANFNETLKLKVNMYFDTAANKFIEKKCLYSFLIWTQKGQKSAGSVTIDLSEMLNDKAVQMDKWFNLEKCPVKETKVNMKIYFQDEPEEKGYDSMSQISATSQMDISTTSDLDISQLENGNGDQSAEKKSQAETQKSSRVQEKDDINLKDNEKFEKLEQSEVEGSNDKSNNISHTIKDINNITNKINEHVSKCSGNLKYQMEGYKRKNNQLEEELNSLKSNSQKYQQQLNEQRKQKNQLEKAYQNLKDQTEEGLKTEKNKNQSLEQKNTTLSKLIKQLQDNMSEKGQSQSGYIEELKKGNEKEQQKLKGEIEEQREALLESKKIKNELNMKLTQITINYKNLQQNYGIIENKNNNLEEDLSKKQKEIQEARENLEKAYDNLVQSLGNVL